MLALGLCGRGCTYTGARWRTSMLALLQALRTFFDSAYLCLWWWLPCTLPHPPFCILVPARGTTGPFVQRWVSRSLRPVRSSAWLFLYLLHTFGGAYCCALQSSVRRNSTTVVAPPRPVQHSA